MTAPDGRVSRRAALAAVLVVAGLSGSGASAGDVTVFAAASLGTALAGIEAGFEATSGHAVTVSLAGSSALARQIQQGAPADIFISANSDWMDLLEAEGLLEPGTRSDLLTNRLVLIAHGAGAAPVEIGAGLELPAMLGDGRLAMALVDAVPAGIYGKAALENLGLWDGIRGQVAQVDNVRAALALVALGEAPLGIVYATDAVAEPRVSVIGTFPAESHPPIVYPVADLTSRDTPAEAAFLAYLRSPEAEALFRAQGFGIVPP